MIYHEIIQGAVEYVLQYTRRKIAEIPVKDSCLMIQVIGPRENLGC